MTTVTLRNASPASVKADAVVIGVRSVGDDLLTAPEGDGVAESLETGAAGTLKRLGVSGKPGDVTKLAGGTSTKAPVILLAGLGDDAEVDLESLRRAAGAAIRNRGDAKTVAIALPATTDEQIRAVVEGALLGGYTFDRYLDKKPDKVEEILVLTNRARAKTAGHAAAAAQVVAEAVNFSRDLVNTPPNDLYPQSFADALKDRSRQLKSKVTVTVLDERTLASKGYGGIMGVGQGSERQPRLARLSYKPPRAKAHIALVGKGITFDSGGLSIKTGSGMMTMKCDMAGAAAVSSAVFAIAELGLPVRVTGYACLAENMPSGAATRPGDVLTMFGGQTVEVLNTDAEGRLVLADGISTANGDKPDVIIDVATLTGACMIALGRNTYGVFSNDEDLQQELTRVADRAGERAWALPIPEEMHEKVRSTKIADLSQHNPEPWGGALFAAAFLREFVADGIPWAHLDIAGPAFNEGSPAGYTPKGGTGTAVRTLIQLAVERAW
ncbi:MAG: leucyl aminopeptidase [Nocardioidaceae bacterium]|nr:leucyl aminopeptidase [Nocardioidaceae bacterium]